jgi:hypothetical protein
VSPTFLWLGGAVFLLSTIILWLIQGRALQQTRRLLAEAARHNEECIATAKDAKRLHDGMTKDAAKIQGYLEEATRLRRAAIQAWEIALAATDRVH